MVNSHQPRSRVSRLYVLRAVGVLVFLALAGQLWRLQIVQGDAYRWKADTNRFRELLQPAARGVIYDRQGRILARNLPRYQVSVIPEDLPDDDEEQQRVLRRLLYLLRTNPSQDSSAEPSATEVVSPTASFRPLDDFPSLEEIQEEVEESGAGGFHPLLIGDNVLRETALKIQEESSSLPGIRVDVQPRREYPDGAFTSHVVGYTGPIPEERATVYADQGYLPTDQIGLAGLEATFQDDLRGRPGRRTIVVDVHGREVGSIGQPQPSEPGNNLVLTVDVALQRTAESALRAGLAAAYRRAGVVIAMDPRNGAVLAMVSLPSYDNNLFAQGISATAYAALSEDPDRPLVNHAISGIYPPGSTFKIIPAAAGLQEGVITPRTELGDNEEPPGANDGIMWLPNRYFPWDRGQDQPFYCWVHELGYGHGKIGLVTALAVSCDIYFYQLAGGFVEFEGVGLSALEEYALLFGLGQTSGIDLPAENPGLVPDARWKRLTYGASWVTGDTYNIAIGQGYLLTTPLQLLNATVAVANGGYLYRPQLVQRITDADGDPVQEFAPDLIRELPIAHEHLEVVRQGMYEAVNWEHGTAPDAAIPGVAVAGKTGTAEYFEDRNGDGWPDRDAQGMLPTHAWFTAFAPYDDPEIALVVLVEGGGEGSKIAVPVAAEILRSHFSPSPKDGEILPETPPEADDEPDSTPTAEAANGQ